jgi:pectate lyase
MKNIFFLLVAIVTLLSCKKKTDTTDNNNNVGTIPLVFAANIGFASQNGGTTGGDAAKIVTATNYIELKNYLESPINNYIVKVEGRIYNNTSGGSIRVRSNKTLIGTTANAFLDGVGLTIDGYRNVIVRNIKFSMSSITNRTDPMVYSPTGDEGRPQILVNGGDAIRISNSTNIWIDHCEFFNEDPDVQTNQDLYDGLVDIGGNSAFITVSWNYFHNHHKVHLIGSSDSDSPDRRTTFAFNYYNKVKQRLPSYRFGTAHVYNNYFNNIGSSAINSRMGACIKVENNVFETVRSPLTTDGSPTGRYELSNNSFTGISGTAAPTTSTCTASIPYTYELKPVSEVKALVIAGAGVGKL